MEEQEYRERLENMDNDDLFGAEIWQDIVSEEITRQTNAYNDELYEKDDEDLFGDERFADIRARRIEALCEEWEEEE